MASLNKAVPSQYTHEGAKARQITPEQQLERSVMSCLLWEDGFYEEGQTIAERIQTVASLCSVDFVIETAYKAKHEQRLRHVPLWLALNLLERKGLPIQERKKVGALIQQLLTRPDDLTELLSMYWIAGKRPLPAQLKKVFAKALVKFDRYQITKYKQSGKTIKLRDIARLCHPKAESEEQSETFKMLLEDTLPLINTWETRLSHGEDKANVWRTMIKEGKLGGLATLRNIRNMTLANVEHSIIKQGIRNINPGRLLPINFIASAKYNPRYESDIEAKFLEAFAGKDVLDGDTAVLVDVSYSMSWSGPKGDMTNLDVACGLAMIAKETFRDVSFFSFSEATIPVPARRGFGLKDAIRASQPHYGTYLGQAIRDIQSTTNWDRIIVITDEQSGDSVPDFDGYLINVASNKNGVGYGKAVHIDGWSDKVIDYIVAYEQQL